MQEKENKENKQPDIPEEPKAAKGDAGRRQKPAAAILADAPVAAGDSGGSLADKLYQEITAVIGGNNPNQFFCMGLPGTSLDASQYSYDIDSHERKPAQVAANESKLVNKLFDACTMSASDNGRHLQTQYKTALDMLTPKLNGKLFEAKTKLRKVLMTPYPYEFGDGTPNVGLTLQQVFYKLYGEYVQAKQDWTRLQLEKKSELTKKYSGGTEADSRKIENEYLEWYETIGESQVLRMEEKLGKVLNVFSPGDMEIINGILDSGSGREIAEARTVLSNVERLSPDGGYVYPVTLYPENWFTLLDNSFTPMDLLESPGACAQKLTVLLSQRSRLTSQINQLLAASAPGEEVDQLREAYANADKAYSDAQASLSKIYTDVTVNMVQTLVEIVAKREKKDASGVPEETVARIFGVDVGDVGNLLKTLGEGINTCLEAQKKVVEAAQTASDLAMRLEKGENARQFKALYEPLENQLEEVKQQIEALQARLRMTSGLQEAGGESGGVGPNSIPAGYTQLLISSTLSEANHASNSSASASQSSGGVSFFFGGYSSSRKHQEAVSSSMDKEENMSIDIGMSVAKVTVGREWFNPGVFQLSADMYNTSSEHIAPAEDYTSFSSERFEKMNQCVFPCFPVAFVIARDVTIRFSASGGISTAFAQSVEDHSAHGGGFFIFGGSSSSSSQSSSSNSCATSTSKSVTVRFTSPQILGYYLEATPADKSVSISSTESQSSADFISIFDFIQAFQTMLDDYNHSYHKQTLQLDR